MQPLDSYVSSRTTNDIYLVLWIREILCR